MLYKASKNRFFVIGLSSVSILFIATIISFYQTNLKFNDDEHAKNPGFDQVSAKVAKTKQIDETIEVLVAENTSSLLVANDNYGLPNNSSLRLEGTSLTTPPFTISADIAFENGWKVSNYQNSPITSGYYKPSFNYSSFTIYSSRSPGLHYLTLSGSLNWYKMRIRIYGTTNDDVTVAAIDGFAIVPWTGSKHGYVLKGRDVESYSPNDPNYNDDTITLQAIYDYIGDNYRRKSNGILQADYDVKEAYTPFDPSWAGQNCENLRNEISSRLLSSLGINGSNYRNYYDWESVTLYKTMMNKMQCGRPQGYSVFAPGFWYPDVMWGFYTDGPPGYKTEILKYGQQIATHEFGHGLYLQHPRVNLYCSSTTSRDAIKEDELYGSCSQWEYAAFSNMGGSGINDGPRNDSNWWSPIEKARVGWLKGTQKKLVTESGTYDLYSENADLSSDPTKPLLLQILVKRGNSPDFVYLNMMGTGMDTMELSTPAGTANGIGAINQHIYDYNNNNPEPYGNDGTGHYNYPIPFNKPIRLKWEDTDIQIQSIAQTGNKTQVKITYGINYFLPLKPTYTPTPTVTPIPTSTPSPTPSPWPTPAPGELAIYGYAWFDSNMDGREDVGETKVSQSIIYEFTDANGSSQTRFAGAPYWDYVVKTKVYGSSKIDALMPLNYKASTVGVDNKFIDQTAYPGIATANFILTAPTGKTPTVLHYKLGLIPIDYVTPTKPPTGPGCNLLTCDLNADGQTNSFDRSFLNNCLETPYDTACKPCDVTGGDELPDGTSCDGEINELDATLLEQSCGTLWVTPSITPTRTPTKAPTKTPTPTLSLPSNLTSKCSADNKSVTLSWKPSSTSVNYSVRLDNMTNAWSNNCAKLNSGDKCSTVSRNTITFAISPRTNYRWWIQMVRPNGTSVGSLLTGAKFSCPTSNTPTPSKAPTAKPSNNPLM